MDDMEVSKPKKRKKGKLRSRIFNSLSLYSMLLLPVAFYVVICYAPMYGITIAFKDYNIFKGILESPWIGLRTFQVIFSTNQLANIIRNTLMLNLLDLAVGFPVPIFLALVINEVRFNAFKRFTQTVIYLPHFLSWVVIGGMVYQFFATNSGLVNVVIRQLGFDSIPFLSNKWYWLITYNLSGVWQSAGWGTIIYLAGLSGVNPELYEAAEVDGANKLRRMWHVSLPCLRPTIVVLLIMKVGQMMSIGFERPFTMGNPMVYEFSEVISTYVYNVGLQNARFSDATAIGLFQSLIGIILLTMANFISKRLGDDGLM